MNFFKNKLKGYFINNQSIPSIKRSMQHLHTMGYTPSCVFDVGAYRGEFSKLCLEIWPQAKVICFEPLVTQFAALKKWEQTDKRVKVLHGLVGNKNVEKVKFNESETASSVLDEFISTDFNVTYQPMHTLDTYINDHNLPLPSLVKIDTQGFEYEVIEGLLGTIGHVDVILAELNHIDIHKDVHLAEDVIGLLYKNGFVIYDVAEIHRRPKDNAIWQTDFIFVKANSFLRKDKSWK